MEKIIKYFSDWWNMSAEECGLLFNGKISIIFIAISLIFIITCCVSKKVRNIFF